jgi:predicted permease
VCVLSDALWRRRFDADPHVIGRTIQLDRTGATVIGVMGPDFANPMSLQDPVDLWTPYIPTAAERVRSNTSRTSTISAVARLKPGMTVAAAQHDLDRITANMLKANPEWNSNVLVGLRPLRDHLVDGRTTDWMLLLFGAVALVLAIACANVANLLLARGSARDRDIAVRVALGASRWDILRQLLVESLVLSTLGTVAAVLVASWGVVVLRNALPATVPHVGAIDLDAGAFALAAALAIGTGLVFGLAPSVRASRTDVTRTLGDAARGGTMGRRRSRFGDALVIAEVGLSTVLLIAAALFVGSFRTVAQVPLGFSPDRVISLGLAPTPGRTANATAANDIGAVVDALGRTPGVVHAAFIAGGTPIVGRGFSAISLPNRWSFSLRRVTPDYFGVLTIPLRHGRRFDERDRTGSPAVAIIDEAAAAQFFSGRDAIGQTIPLDGGREVIGIVGDIRQIGPERPIGATVYVPLAQSPVASGDFVLQTAGDPLAMLPSLRAVVRGSFPDVPVRYVESLSAGLERALALRRFTMLLVGLLGSLGVMIAAVGLYGVLAYAVARREREIGVRMALGASPDAVVRMVIGRAAALVGAGLALGGFGAWALGGTAKAFLFRMNIGDPRVYVAAFCVLLAAAIAATVIPARRAAAVDPLIALRSE